MSKLDIIIYPNPLLRQRCNPVVEATPEIIAIMDDMAETMYDANGIGLAASQVGCLHRVIVVDIGDDEENSANYGLLKMINPVILQSSGAIEIEEGCLSIPDVRANVKRPSSISLQYQIANKETMKLENVQVEATGLFAVCVQHEIDHLNGVLFIDHLSFLQKELLNSKLNKLSREYKKGNPRLRHNGR